MKNICSLITIYKPDVIKLTCNIKMMLEYSDIVYLLFNSPIIPELQFDERIICLFNGKNIGISRAINKGVDKAANDGFLYAILFDQDTCLTNDNLKKLLAEMYSEEELRQIACIGPSLNVRNNIIQIPKWSKNGKTTKLAATVSVNNIITSGMLINTKHFLALRGFNEDFPLDFCDFLFCWKALYKGYVVLQSTDAYIIHEIGTHGIKIFSQTIHFHAPYRNYFLVRDTLAICFRTKETPMYIRFRYLIFLPFRMLLYLIMLDKKTMRLKMYCMGIIDFIMGKKHFGSIAKMLDAE